MCSTLFVYNDTLKATVAAYPSKVYIADSHAAFAASEENLSNANDSSFDFHPNATGHRVIADTFGDIIGTVCPAVASVFGTGGNIAIVGGVGLACFILGFIAAKYLKRKKTATESAGQGK